MNEIDKYANVLWDYNRMHHQLPKSDAILALGSMDMRVAKRAADLWHQGLAPVVVTSGGFGRLSGEDTQLAEADKFKAILNEQNVPDEAIMVENNSTNTAENLQLSIELLKNNGIDAKNVIVVTIPYAEKRTYATVKKLFPDVQSWHTSPQESMDEYPQGEVTKDLMINIMVGDAKRIEVYPSNGFTVEMPMPQEAKDAMQWLIDHGYDKQLPG